MNAAPENYPRSVQFKMALFQGSGIILWDARLALRNNRNTSRENGALFSLKDILVMCHSRQLTVRTAVARKKKILGYTFATYCSWSTQVQYITQKRWVHRNLFWTSQHSSPWTVPDLNTVQEAMVMIINPMVSFSTCLHC